jgi:hypothetical protein
MLADDLAGLECGLGCQSCGHAATSRRGWILSLHGAFSLSQVGILGLCINNLPVELVRKRTSMTRFEKSKQHPEKLRVAKIT